MKDCRRSQVKVRYLSGYTYIRRRSYIHVHVAQASNGCEVNVRIYHLPQYAVLQDHWHRGL